MNLSKVISSKYESRNEILFVKKEGQKNLTTWHFTMASVKKIKFDLNCLSLSMFLYRLSLPVKLI
jgi:hypothetical protein